MRTATLPRCGGWPSYSYPASSRAKSPGSKGQRNQLDQFLSADSGALEYYGAAVSKKGIFVTLTKRHFQIREVDQTVICDDDVQLAVSQVGQ